MLSQEEKTEYQTALIMEITGEVERHAQIIFELKEKISKKGGGETKSDGPAHSLSFETIYILRFIEILEQVPVSSWEDTRCPWCLS